MHRIGRRRFIARQLQAAAAFAMTSCRSLSWLDQDPDKKNTTQSEGKLGLSDPPIEQLTDPDTSLKNRARRDYHESLKPYGGWLAQAHTELKTSYDVFVVGSGYGGAIVAARLAAKLAPGKSLCIMERGREWNPGDFPDTFKHYLAQVTAQNPLGLYEIKAGKELDVIQGSGLGGTSLINANVAAIPDADVFLSPRWPAALRNIGALMPYYERAMRALGAKPTSPQSTGKAKTMQYIAQNLGEGAGSFAAADITVTTEPPSTKNPAGMMQRACTFCGDCMTGCNVGAKNTLVYNYLPLAKRAGAEIFCELSVLSIRAEGDGYVISYSKTADTEYRWWKAILGSATPKAYGEVRARVVVLGAGSLGSTGILLRSQSMLATSPKLGQNFSANGDAFAIYKDISAPQLKAEPNSGGTGAFDAKPGAGPSIQTITKVNASASLRERMVIEDVAIPRAFVPSFEFTVLGSAKRSMFLLGMGHDDSDGTIELDRFGLPRVSWPSLNEKPFFKTFNLLYASIEGILKGRIPSWKALLMRSHHETAHPLGGCCMADTVSSGVVNDKCQVFRPDGTVHKNLYVVDGAVIPTSLGINPLLTISAVAERAAEGIAADRALADLFHQEAV